MFQFKLIIFLFLVIASSFLFADKSEKIKIQKINGDINLDGLSNEEAWKGIIPFSPIMQRPQFGEDPSEHTEILLAYDENYIYAAGRLFDKEPGKIQTTSFKRDDNNASSEWFGFALDTYNDKENAVAFFTTPAGLRWDANIVEGTGGVTINTDWNTFWDVAVIRNSNGWFAEFRIPFSSLRFQVKDSLVTMGVISWRLIARKNEWIIFPSIPDKWPTSFYKISRAQEIYFEHIREKKTIYISPYSLAGKEESNILQEPKTSYQKAINNKYEIGFDAKYGINSNLTLDATVNTDFSQVEVDDRVISLDRFSIYLPEKRQFFLERSRNFDFTFSNSNQIFYSRRIGINNSKPVRVYGGIRLVGRIGKTDLGFLNMQTASVDSFPSENQGILRLKRQIFNTNSYIGGIITTKIGLGGNYNIVHGIDGVIQIGNDDYLKIAAAQSQDNKYKNALFSKDNLRYHIELERRSNEGFSYLVNTSMAGKDYNPGLGFENWQNYINGSFKLQYSWLAGSSSRFYRTSINMQPYIFWNNSDGKIDSYELNPLISTSTKGDFQFKLINHFTCQNVRTPLTFLGKINIPAGYYRFYFIETEVNTPSIYPYKTLINFKAGSFYDGQKASIIVQPAWNLSRYLELGYKYQYDMIKILSRNQKVYSHLLSIKALFMFNTKLSIAAFVQYSSIDKISFSNIRFHYNPVEGNDLYIVYNHGFNIDRNELSPIPPVTNQWSINIKYQHAISF